MTSRTVGLIGVGLVGTAQAERFLAAGWRVVGYDTATDRREALRALNGVAVDSPHEVVTAADTIVLSLPTSDIVGQVLEPLQSSLAGKLVIDTTTGEPGEMAELGARLARRGIAYLDATIAGSSAQVRSGEVVVMVGGPAEAVSQSRELLATFASRVFHLGPWGAGARMKLVVNLVLGLNRAVLAEGLAFAEHLGVDPRQALDVLQASPAASRVMETKGRKMLDRDFRLQARLAQHLKDVRLILAAGRQSGARLPLSTLHEQLLAELDQAGCGDLDNSAIIRAFQTEPPA